MLSSRIRALEESATLALSARAAALRAAGREVISFTAGELDLPPPPAVLEAVGQALARGQTRYTPTGGTPELRAAIAAAIERDTGIAYRPEQIVVSNGAKQSLYNLLQVLCEPGDEVIIPRPYWVSYPAMARLAEAVPVLVETRAADGFKLTAAALEQALGPRSRVLVLNSPNNPTGAVYEEAELRQLAEVVLAHPRLFVIADAIYGKLVFDRPAAPSLLRAAPQVRERAALVDGVSKTYAMTGFRIGWAAGPREVMEGCLRLQSHSTSCAAAPCQAAALAALTGGEEPLAAVRALLAERRRLMVERLQRLPGLALVPPQGAFYCFPSVAAWLGQSVAGSCPQSTEQLCQLLLEHAQVALVPGEAFGAPGHVRLSFALATEELVRGLERLEGFLREQAPAALPQKPAAPA